MLALHFQTVPSLAKPFSSAKRIIWLSFDQKFILGGNYGGKGLLKWKMSAKIEFSDRKNMGMYVPRIKFGENEWFTNLSEKW